MGFEERASTFSKRPVLPMSDDVVFTFGLDFPTAAVMVAFLFFRQPPPMGTLRRAPPFVQ